MNYGRKLWLIERELERRNEGDFLSKIKSMNEEELNEYRKVVLEIINKNLKGGSKE